jgi:hypothetical protein
MTHLQRRLVIEWDKEQKEMTNGGYVSCPAQTARALESAGRVIDAHVAWKRAAFITRSKLKAKRYGMEAQRVFQSKEFLDESAFREQQPKRKPVKEKIDTYTDVRQCCEKMIADHGMIAATAIRDALIAEINARLSVDSNPSPIEHHSFKDMIKGAFSDQ